MPAPQVPVSSVDSEAQALRDYGQTVKRAVMQNMEYPQRARMRNWQGVTIVRIDLSPEGDVTKLEVAESSGKGVLDDAAVKMVKRSLPLPKPPLGVRTVTVPVDFRLRG
jgi:TonB family protein